MTNELSEFLKKIRTERNLTLRELSKLTGLSHSYLHHIETGMDPRNGKPVSPTLPTLIKLANGLDVPIEQVIYIASENITTYQRRLLKTLNLHSESDIKMKNLPVVPVLTKIVAGDSDYLQHNIESWMAINKSTANTYELSKYYYLRVHGDSMEPLFNDQDLVLVKQGPVDDGQIAVVLCDGENACVKRVQYLKENQLIMLVSRNPAYPPVMKSIDECKVLGKVILRIGEPRW